MRGADALIRALERAGVDTVFGIPGGACLPIYDALHDSPIRHVLMRHEAAAGHAAEGYARATGRVGVAIATSGPGATNLVTPIADAQMDSVPTLFITGQVKTTLRGTNAFQEADVIGITQPIVKHSIAVERADDIAQAVVDALHDRPQRAAGAGADRPPDATSPRPGARRDARAVPARLPAAGAAQRAPGARGRAGDRDGAAARCSTRAAASCTPRRRTSCGRSRRLAGLPVTTTLMALGAFPASDRRWLGMLGMHGTRAANWAMDEADLIVAVGARFDDRVTGALDEFAPRAKIVHIDVDPAEIGKNVDGARAGRGRREARRWRRCAERLRRAGRRPGAARRVVARIRGWQAEHPLRAPEHGGRRVDAEVALDALAGRTAATRS